MSKKIEVQIAMQDKLSTTVDKVRGKIQQLSKSFGNFTRKLVNLRNIVAVAIFSKIATAIVGAASKMEVFGNQLKVVEGNAGEAAKKLAEMREFARTSPLETEDVVQSYVRLRAVGIKPTIDEMKTMGGVAVLFNTQMTEVLNSFIGLNKKTLRRLGIEIDRTGSKAVIMSGNIKKEVEKDSASIRRALLEVWEERFPNAIETAANTSVAKTAIMKSEVFELAAAVGEKLLPAWNAVIVAIGLAAANMREFINPSEITSIETVTARIKELKAELEAGFVRKEGGKLGSLSIVNREEIEKDLAFLETVRNKLAAQGFETERIKGLEKRRDDFIAAETAKREAAAKTAAAAARAAAKAEALRIKENAEIAKWLDDQVLMTNEEEFAKIQLMKDRANNRTEITQAEWEERNRIQFEAMSIGKSQRQLEFEEEIALLEQKKILYPQLEEEIQALIKKKKDEYREIDYKANEQHINSVIDANMRLGSTLNNLASLAVANSKASAKKRQNILIALAVAEGAASAVTAAKAGWDSAGGNVYLGAVLAAAGALEAIALTASYISSIKAQKFARGTSFAPGGMAIVGEEGPEAMFIPRGSQVMTNAQTRNNFGATNLSFNVNIAGDASDRTVEKLNSSLEQFGTNFTNAIRKGHIDPQRLGFVTV